MHYQCKLLALTFVLSAAMFSCNQEEATDNITPIPQPTTLRTQAEEATTQEELIKESLTVEEVMEEDMMMEGEGESEESMILVMAETGETIEVANMEELRHLFQTEYQDLEGAAEAVEKTYAFEFEYQYAQTLDLDNPDVVEEYLLYLERTYGDEAGGRSGNGILYDGQGSGFLSFTNIPWNLRRNKRNRASSWVGIVSGLVFLCDWNWWSGQKVVVFGIGQINLGNLNFNNRTNSFF